jgi:hypothetical protein
MRDESRKERLVAPRTQGVLAKEAITVSERTRMRTLLRICPAIAVAVILALTASATAHANIVFQLGNNPQPNEQNVLLNTGASGATITGTLNQSGDIVTFTSATQTLTEPANGQARVEAVGATGGQVALKDVTSITLATNYQDIIFNSNISGRIGTSGGTETVKVVDNLGMTHSFDLTLKNGSNFLTVFATNGESIAATSISYPTGFTDLRQVRISTQQAIPEPSTLALAGTGFISLLAVYGWRRRRDRRA